MYKNSSTATFIVALLCIATIFISQNCSFSNTNAVVYEASAWEEEYAPVYISTSYHTTTVNSIYPVYGFTYKDIYLMATLLCGDKDVAGDGEYDFVFVGEDRYDQIALVLCVVMNRVNDPRFPNTVEEVIWQKDGGFYQFSVMRQWANGRMCTPDDEALRQVARWCLAYDRGAPEAQTIPKDHLYFHGDGIVNHSSTSWSQG